MSDYGLAISILDVLPRRRALDLTAQAGFMLVELSGREGSGQNWIADPATMRRDLEAAGLAASSVHCAAAGWDLAAHDEAARRSAIEAARQSFRPAVEVGADVVVCHTNAAKTPFEPADYHASLARSAESLKALADAAGRAGVRLAVETMMARPIQRPATRIREILDLIEGLGDHVGICLDTGHSHAAGVDLADEAVLAGRKLFTLHLQDNHGRLDEDEHLIPGCGTIDWGRFLDGLDRLDFAGPRIFEVKLLDGPEGPERTVRELEAVMRTWQSRRPPARSRPTP